MGARFAYFRWDGTQKGFELDADGVLDALTDDLLFHGDVNSAMRRLMQEGLHDLNGNRLTGLREMMEKLRVRREDIESRGDLGGVYGEIADELNDIVDEERHAVENYTTEAKNSGDRRRTELAEQVASDRNFRLDMLPADLAGKVAELQHYDFQSKEAQQRFEQLLDKLRHQVLQQSLDQMAGAVQSLTPADMQHMKDMLSELNNMLQRRQHGEDPQFEIFMEKFGDFFPESPKTLDELLEIMARRMAVTETMLNSMSPEQRAQLQALSDQSLDDMDLRWQMDQLAQNLQSMFPELGWNRSYNFDGQDPIDFQEAMRWIQELSELEQLENLIKHAAHPAALAEVDMDQVRDLLGDDAARSLTCLAEFAKILEEAGLIEQTGGRLTLTPRGLRKIGTNALKDIFGKLAASTLGEHQVNRLGIGHERTYGAKPYEYGDSFQLDLERTLRNALHRSGPGVPMKLSPDDFEIEQTEHLTRSSTVLMLDLSLSMPMRDNFLPAKKVAMALHSLISTQFPRDYLGIVGFGEVARELNAHQLPEVSWDFVYGTNMQHAFALSRHILDRQSGTKQIIMITDGEPTAHITPSGDVFFNYPPDQETVEATLREVVRCTRSDIRINSFILDADDGLRGFVERLARINRGRVFFASPDTLGDYVLIDFLEHKRELSVSAQ